MINPFKVLKNIPFKKLPIGEIKKVAGALIPFMMANIDKIKEIFNFLKDNVGGNNDTIKKELDTLQANFEKLKTDFKKLHEINLEQQKIIDILRYQNKLIIIISLITIVSLVLYIFLH